MQSHYLAVEETNQAFCTGTMQSHYLVVRRPGLLYWHHAVSLSGAPCGPAGGLDLLDQGSLRSLLKEFLPLLCAQCSACSAYQRTSVFVLGTPVVLVSTACSQRTGAGIYQQLHPLLLNTRLALA
ncbi:unnamed protein product [Boreogadus saida]